VPSIYELNELALGQWQRNLASSSGFHARQYLQRRGISDSQIDKFGIGLAVTSQHLISDILTKQGISHQDALASGLIVSDSNDRFRNRLMFPIHDADGRLIAFGGRTLKEDGIPKYLNSPETEVYSKRDHLYNLNRAKTAIEDSGSAIVVEGYMDVIGLDRAGVHNVVATCGTALSQGHAKLLRDSASMVFLSFDGDEAGTRATYRAIPELLRAGCEVRIVRIPSGDDPDEHAARNGADGYYALLEKAQTFLAWGVEAGRYLHDNLTAEGREAMLVWMIPLLRLAGNERLANTVAKELGVIPWTARKCLEGGRSRYTREDATQALSFVRQLDDVALTADTQ
jgi:DNA primase